ncbi:hypothetical protein N9399_02370 [Porticoccaceae bacterium]|nr:hypothetical protein [Porticoccaceae bacterium]
MRKLQLIFVLGFVMTSNAFAKVVVESVNCGDAILKTPADIYFEVTDFGKLWPQFSKSVQNQDKDTSDKKSRNDLNELIKSMMRPKIQADKLKNIWLGRTYIRSDDTGYMPQIGPKNNKRFLDWAHGPQSEIAFCTVYLQIYGKIQNDDVTAVKKAITGFANPPFLSVKLNSRGGSVEAGIEIGRIIRKHYGSTSISHYHFSQLLEKAHKEKNAGNSQKVREYVAQWQEIANEVGVDRSNTRRPALCYSACALIYAGGIARLPNLGNLGVHQHFFSDSALESMSVEEGVINIRKTTRNISQYLEELGVNQSFLQLALSVNQDDIHIISKREHQLLLPHAVIEYANIIPKKKEEHVITFIKIYSNAISGATNQVDRNADLRQLLELAYLNMAKHKEVFRWANFQAYDLTVGKYYQSL